MATRYGWMTDTNENAFEVLLDLQRKTPAGEKLRQVLEMMVMGVRLDEDRVRREHPQASEREVFLWAATLRLGREIVKRVYGWDPEDHPGPA